MNDKPHVGHAYATIIADVLARFHRRIHENVVFTTGTDEHSQKTIEAAQRSHEDVVSYTNRLADQWRTTWHTLGISHTDFIRTSQQRHIDTVYAIWDRVNARGDIYKGTYTGLYCSGCESFKKESDLIDGVCPDHKRVPEQITEENYFFSLSRYREQLLAFYADHPDFVIPQHRYREIISFVENGLEDISISREGKQWGIPVHGDPDHVVYVWFDALINYISLVGVDGWINHPADIQVMGKDILRFHAVIWPAMLLSAGLPLPRQLLATGFFTNDGQKISKSLGNAIDPLELTSRYGRDALRYFLLRELAFGEDGDFSNEKFHNRYHSDLANGLGNFTARVLAMAYKIHPIPFADVDPLFAQAIHVARETVASSCSRARFHDALFGIWELIGFGDRYINTHKPWENGGDVFSITQLVLVLEALGDILSPFLPDTAAAIQSAIVRDASNGVFTITPLPVLFPRIS